MFLQRQSPKKAGKEKLHFGLFLGLFFCSIITSLLHDVEHTLKPLDFQGVSVFFAHLSKFTFQGKQFVVFSV